MEILEHGWVYNLKHGITECKCGCKYKYDEEDVKDEPQLYLDWNLKHRYFLRHCVVCPECGEKDWVGEGIPITKEEYNRRRESE